MKTLNNLKITAELKKKEAHNKAPDFLLKKTMKKIENYKILKTLLEHYTIVPTTLCINYLTPKKRKGAKYAK